MIKISVAHLKKEPVALIGTEGEEFLDLPADDQFAIVSPMSYDLVATYVSGSALVTGVCRLTISGICGRCLERAQKVVETPELKLYFDLSNVKDFLDISDDIRSEMLLALPVNFLCREDCLGLCPFCGGNRNENPCDCREKNSGGDVWSALDKLDLK